ncbi:MAG: ABC transporter permease, partial [Planctomycetota bacterium]
MRKILEIASREYIETVKTKTFIFMILMLPVMIGAIAFFAGRLDSRKGTSRQPIRIGVTDLSGRLSDKIVEDAFEEHNTSNPNRSVDLQEFQTSEEQGKEKLRRGELDVYVVLDEDILEESGTIQLYTHEPRPAVAEALWTVESPLRTAVFSERLNLSPEKLNNLRKVKIERMKTGTAGAADRVQSEADRMVRVLTPFFFMYLLFIGILTMGQQMLSSIIE